MKRIFSAVTAAVTALTALAVPVTAEDAKEQWLPFELSKPTDVSLLYLDGNDSPNTCEIHYSQNNSMSEWSTRKGDYEEAEAVFEELQEHGYDDLNINAQIDWAVDSTDEDAWHVNEYWLTDGFDENNIQRLGDWAYTSANYFWETALYEWIFRGMGNISDPDDRIWYGAHNEYEDFSGWKDVLDKDWYDVIVEDEETSYAKFNFEEHTLYARVRWRITLRKIEDSSDIYVVSDWSDIAAYGKDAGNTGILKPGDVASPDISDLKYTKKEFNGWPVASFKLAVDDKLREQITRVSGTQGAFWIEVQARVQGREEWVGLQGDWIVKAGDMEIDLQNLAEYEERVPAGTPLEMRARYVVSQSSVENDFATEWSDIIKFSSWEIKMGDVNSDGRVDLDDYSDLAKYLAQWKGYDDIVNLRTADLDGSGSVDLDDLSILAKCLADWKGYRSQYLGETE